MNKNRGALDNDLLIFLGLFLVLGLAWVTMSSSSEKAKQGPLIGILQNVNPSLDRGTSSGDSEPGSSSEGNKETSTTITLNGIVYTKSPWYKQVRLSSGSAGSQSVATKEYVVLGTDYKNKTGINITGWKLQNGRGLKITQPRGGARAQVLPSQWATIPQGSALFLLDKSVVAPIVLLPGDKALVTTGSLKTGGDWPVRVSFKTNMCTGYLADNERTEFIPSLRRNCPRISDDPQTEKLDDRCYEFVRRYPTCHNPDTKPYRDFMGDTVRNHIDKNTEVSKLCREWVVNRSNYSACVATNFADADFDGGQWRVFLNRDWELWDNDREVITLYDATGLLVDQISY